MGKGRRRKHTLYGSAEEVPGGATFIGTENRMAEPALGEGGVSV